MLGLAHGLIATGGAVVLPRGVSLGRISGRDPAGAEGSSQRRSGSAGGESQSAEESSQHDFLFESPSARLGRRQARAPPASTGAGAGAGGLEDPTRHDKFALHAAAACCRLMWASPGGDLPDRLYRSLFESLYRLGAASTAAAPTQRGGGPGAAAARARGDVVSVLSGAALLHSAFPVHRLSEATRHHLARAFADSLGMSEKGLSAVHATAPEVELNLRISSNRLPQAAVLPARAAAAARRELASALDAARSGRDAEAEAHALVVLGCVRSGTYTNSRVPDKVEGSLLRCRMKEHKTGWP